LLEAATDLRPLRAALTAKFRGRGEVLISDVERFVLVSTAYSEKIHLKERTLVPMEKGNMVTARHQFKSRRRYTYPDGTLITFL
jgi:hypothetical protein